MLGLFRDRDKQIKLHQETAQINREKALRKKYDEIDENADFNKHLSSGEKVRNDLQEASLFLQTKQSNQNILSCEELINKEQEEEKLEKDREDKVRQLLWSTSPELQNLKKMLLVADVTRDQAMQIAEKQALRQLEKERDDLLADIASKEWKAQEAVAKEKELEDVKAKLKYHQELDELREYKKNLESSNYSQQAKEKAAIDEIKKQIEEEDLKHAKEKIQKQKELRRQMLELQRVRDDIKLREKLKEHSEAQKIDEYLKVQDLRTRKLEEKRQMDLEHRLQVQEELLDFLEKTCREKLKWEQLRTDLAIEEREVEEQGRSKVEEQKQRKVREDLKKVYEMQLKVKKQREELLKKEEQLFRQHLMNKMYEDDKLEVMGMQRRKQKQLEHKRAVEEMLKERHLKGAVEKAKEIAKSKYQAELEAERSRMINEERIRFLKEHASELLGYLPKGIFQDTQTLVQLGDDVKKFYLRPHCKH